MASWQQEQRNKKLKARIIGGDGRYRSTDDNCKHGSTTGYNYYGCRCPKCIKAKQLEAGSTSYFPKDSQ